MQYKQTGKIFGVLFCVLAFGVLLGITLVDIGYVPVREYTVAVGTGEADGHLQKIAVDLTIDYGNGDIQSFPDQIVFSGSSVVGLLEQSGIVVEKRNFPGLGVFIEAINGVHNSNNYYWQFWINGEYSSIGADQYKLQNGDAVVWKRTNELER
jgi:hypothetical protein